MRREHTSSRGCYYCSHGLDLASSHLFFFFYSCFYRKIIKKKKDAETDYLLLTNVRAFSPPPFPSSCEKAKQASTQKDVCVGEKRGLVLFPFSYTFALFASSTSLKLSSLFLST